MVRCGCLPCFPRRPKASGEPKSKEGGSDYKEPIFGNPPQQPLSDFFRPDELGVLGTLAGRVRVVLDRSLPSTLHGTSRVTDGVPLAIINPRAPDKRYVILHELMHHQLDELGCPSLCCTLQAKEIPVGSWLRRTQFQSFVRGLLVQLWELIQHSRFNAMLLRVFKCGPESARDNEYRGYMSSKSLPTYAMCRSDGHASLKRVAVAAHVATVILEGSIELRRDFVEFVRTRYPAGDDMVKLGEALVACVRPRDLELLKMTRAQLDELMSDMLTDLKNILDKLDTGMTVKVGTVQPLKVKFNHRCSTVAHVDFCEPTSVVSVTAGGFGSHAGLRLEAGPSESFVRGAGFGIRESHPEGQAAALDAPDQAGGCVPECDGVRCVMLHRGAGCGCHGSGVVRLPRCRRAQDPVQGSVPVDPDLTY